ncbi:MAG: hypothetical protein WCD79_17315 [Chthoniobacteraceae bacterium]
MKKPTMPAMRKAGVFPHKGLAVLCWLAFACKALAIGNVETLHMAPASNMTRAELHYVTIVPNPKAVLVLCPGANGSGEELIRESAWQDFAKQNNLGLMGLSFASPENTLHDGTGYYYASKGSGAKLLDGIQKIYHKDLPVLLYGFSGGAHFTSSFEEWMPQRVIAWCADSAAWWDVPAKSNSNPPGIVVCGDRDQRYGASLLYFEQGRRAGKPWLWISIPGIGHAGSTKLDDFVRGYFVAILGADIKDLQEGSAPEMVDIDRKTVVETSGLQPPVSVTGWLPSGKLFNLWCAIHEP